MIKTIQGLKVPALGFGSWQLQGDDCVEGVRDALDIGYRHIDTAQMYENEAEVGKGMADSSVNRQDIWLTTKVWRDFLKPVQIREVCEQSLKNLHTDYLDLLLIHWPNKEYPLADSIEALSKLQESGKIRRFGVSNFPPKLLKEAVSLGEVFAIQVEHHPYLGQQELRQLAADVDLLFTAYSPLARGAVLDDDTIQQIAEKHSKSPAQVTLRWMLQETNVSPIPKSSSHEHRLGNFGALDFELDQDDMKAISALDRNKRLINPDFAPDW